MVKLVVAAAVGSLAAAGIAYATIPGEDGLIHGCRNNATGSLRVIDAGVKSCLPSETALNWSQRGGVHGVTLRGTTGNFDPVVSTATHFCLPGEVALGGGVRVDLSSLEGPIPVVAASFVQAEASGKPIGWTGSMRNLGTGEVAAVVDVICASE